MNTLWHRLKTDDGSATVEFIFLSVLLLIPVIYLLLVVSAVQSASYATAAIADQSARLAATAPNAETAHARTNSSAQLIASDYGLNPEQVDLTLNCTNTPCSTPGTSITATVEVTVGLPLVPTFLGTPTSVVNLSSQAHHYVGEFE